MPGRGRCVAVCVGSLRIGECQGLALKSPGGNSDGLAEMHYAHGRPLICGELEEHGPVFCHQWNRVNGGDL